MGARKVRAGQRAEVSEPPVIPRIGLLLDALPAAVVTTDSAYRINGWNSAAERLFRLTRSSMMSASIFVFLAQELRSVSGIDVKSALDRGESWAGGAATSDAAGAAMELRLTAAPIGAPGVGEGFVIVAHDITAQVRAQGTAEAAEEHFAEFLAADPPLAFIKDQERSTDPNQGNLVGLVQATRRRAVMVIFLA